MLRNFTEGNSRKFTVSFAFCAHVDVIKYRKKPDVSLRVRADCLSFRRQRVCDRKTIGSHLKASSKFRNNNFGNISLVI